MSRFVVGSDSYALQKENQKKEVIWDTSRLSNFHIGITGTSGSGKTHQMKRFLGALDPNVHIDIFDYHGDIDIVNASTVMFSEQTKYGYNPFVVNPDPHYGGLRKSANAIIEIMGQSRKLGENQEQVMRNLIMDCYEVKRITPDNQHSWQRRDASEIECDTLYNQRNWQELAKCFPTLLDLERQIFRKLKLNMLGLDDNNKSKQALYALEGFMRVAKNAKQAKMKGTRSGINVEEIQANVDKAREKAISEYTTAMNAIEDGNEFDDIIKYSSVETLQSLLTRVQNIRALGLFNANPPPFNGNIHRYFLKPMSTSAHELKMFIFSRLMAIYHEEMQRGESGGKLRRIIVIDEAKKFSDDEASNPINIIANEARKFGIGLLLAGQSPDHLPPDFIRSAGTLLIQNLATDDWDKASRKLKIDAKKLSYLTPRKNGMIRLLETGQTARWQNVTF